MNRIATIFKNVGKLDQGKADAAAADLVRNAPENNTALTALVGRHVASANEAAAVVTALDPLMPYVEHEKRFGEVDDKFAEHKDLLDEQGERLQGRAPKSWLLVPIAVALVALVAALLAGNHSVETRKGNDAAHAATNGRVDALQKWVSEESGYSRANEKATHDLETRMGNAEGVLANGNAKFTAIAARFTKMADEGNTEAKKNAAKFAKVNGTLANHEKRITALEAPKPATPPAAATPATTPAPIATPAPATKHKVTVKVHQGEKPPFDASPIF